MSNPLISNSFLGIILPETKTQHEMKTEINIAYINSIKDLKHSQIENLETKIEWLDEICKLIKLEGDPELTVKLIRITQKSIMSLIDTLKEERAAIVNAHNK